MSVFTKEIFRSIRGSLGRFLAIGLIVALGTGFYAGLRMTAPDMNLAANAYYDDTALYDIRVLSSMGLSDDDIAALGEVDGISAVMPAYETDMITMIQDHQYTVRIHSLNVADAEASGDGLSSTSVPDDSDYLNRPMLVSGKWPENPGECVICADRAMNSPVAIGDTVQIVEGSQPVEDVLDENSYTIVGFVRSSYYTSTASLGSTSLGSGVLQQYMYISEDDFADDFPYTEAFLAVEGAREELSSSDEYLSLVDSVMDRIQAIAPAREQARYEEIVGDAQAELDEKRAEYEVEKADALQQLDDAKAKLDDAAATIASSETDLANGQSAYDAGVTELANQRAAAQQQLDAAYTELSDKQTQVDAWASQLSQAQTELDAVYTQWQQSMDAWQAAWDALDPADPAYAQKKAALEQQKQTLDGTKATLDQSQAALDDQKAQLKAAQDQLAAGWGTYDSQKQAADSQFVQAQAQLDASAAQLSSGWQELEIGKADYASGLQEYEDSKAEADQKFADAEKELDDAQQEIDDIGEPTWYVMDRTKNTGAESFKSDAQRVDQIAQVFPFLFFLVAALVALTTMTRMVDEERMQIGTYKALGYGRARITSKYLIYAAIASGVGSIIGIVVLSEVLPIVIMNAYSIMYTLPKGPTPIDPSFAALSAGMGIGVTLLATWGAVGSTLHENPASLMLPRAPKPGKRILLERIGPLWRRVSFSWKVTFRNIFRYKRRFIMTIIGIAGCTALLLTGLGLSDAITDIIQKQYGEIDHYNTTISMDDDISAEDKQQVNAIVDNPDYVSSYTTVFGDSMQISSSTTHESSVYVIVPSDPASFSDFVTLRERVGHTPLALTDNGAIVTEKLSTQLGESVGESFGLSEEDDMGNPVGETYTAVESGITENYIGDFVYMTPTYYKTVTGSDPTFSTIFAISTTDSAKRQEISDDLLAIDGVRTVAFNDETIQSYQKMLQSVNSIVWVLVAAAAVLAFVVLYNLTNINITERQREIATLKVLGFVPREVDAYIYRETILLTILGSLVGLAFGVFMEHFVVVTAEVNQVMFGREIHFMSFVIAFVLTQAFSIIVMISMRWKLNRINMVESLKSIE